MLRQLLIVAALVSVAGCEDKVPMADTLSTQAAKSFSPRPDKATLYVFRSDDAGSVLNLTANQRTLGGLPKKTFLKVDVPPGTWDIRCRSPLTTDSAVSSRVDLMAGTATYVVARFTTANAPSYCSLQSVDPTFAAREISGLQRIQEVGGASD